MLVAIALLLCALLGFAYDYNSLPPTARGMDSEGFSSARAEALLREFLGDEAPHPVASPANTLVKQRILAQLERFGITAEVQQAFACSYNWAVCAQIENIIARIPGDSSDAVLLMAHYDSVPHAPGAGDDGAGVAAVLEVARQLSLEGPHRNTLVLAITDAEEVGLIGAEAFFDQHPAAENVVVALNMEGSGSAGPVQLLRTGRDNRFVIQTYQGVVSDSMANSVVNEIFRHMPNDTDFSVVQRAGIQGIDLSFAGERNHYHTRLDSVDNLDKNTLQHHGNLLLPLARAFLQADLRDTPTGDVVYLDIYGVLLLQWSEQWSLWLTVLAAIMLVFAIRRRSSAAAVAKSGARVLLSCALIGGSLALVFWLLELMVEIPPWPATQWPLLALLFCLTITIGLRMPGGRHFWPVLFANISLWILLAVLTSIYAPGASPLFVAPVLQLGLLVLLTSGMGDTQRLRGIVAVLALLVITPTAVGIVPLLLETQGYQLVFVVFPFLVLFGAMLLCLTTGRDVSRPRTGTVSRFTALAALAVFVLIPLQDMYSSWRPQHVVLYYLEDRSQGAANWLANSQQEISGQLRIVGNLEDEEKPVMPYYGKNPGPVAPAAITDTPAPRLTVISDNWQDGERTVKLQLRSLRKARQLSLRLGSASGLTAVMANGLPMRLKPSKSSDSSLGEHFVMSAFTASPDGVLFELQFDNAAAQTLYFSDVSTQLPESGIVLIKERNLMAAPVHRGDQWVIGAELPLAAAE